MNLEEKLKAKSFIVESEIEEAEMVLLSDALSICQQAVDEACKKQRQETLNLCKTSLPNARILNAHSEYVKGWEDANRQHIRFIENLNAPSPKESDK